MADEFWESDAERQAEILYSLSLICKHDLLSFCMQLFSVGEQLDKEEVMTNAKKFKNIFGLYATELWTMTEQELLDWLGAEPDPTSITSDSISRQAAIDGLYEMSSDIDHLCTVGDYVSFLESLSAQPEIIRCKDCKHWKQQTNYQGALLSFGFCESDEMWRSLYGETYEVSHIDTDDDFYCGYAERRTDGTD